MRLKVEKKRFNAIIFVVSMALLLGLPSKSFGQIGTNVYTPYTVYGIGVLDMQGNSATKQMGGIGAAYRSSVYQNSVNPAAYSAVPQKTFLMSIGMQGVSNYLSSDEGSSSHNGMTLGDFGVLMPIAKGFGVGLAINPMTTVGYYSQTSDVSDDILTNIGTQSEVYSGSGNIVQYKMGAGLNLGKGFSIGANLSYYHGTLNRYNSIVIDNVISDQEFRSVGSISTKRYDYFGGDFGLQYSVVLNKKKMRALGFGLVYQPKVTTTAEDIYLVTSSSTNLTDTAIYTKADSRYVQPAKYTAGMVYSTRTVTLAADYIYQDWSGAFEDRSSRITLKKYQDFRIGVQYTPNRFDIRNAMKRWSYRAGFRYGESYMVVDGYEMDDYSFTFGVGIPMEKGGFSLLNVGGEVGKTGTLSGGMVRDLYVKINIGVTLFGQSDWFTQYKFK